VPKVVFSDNGPCYSSAEFTVFTENYRFRHETSSQSTHTRMVQLRKRYKQPKPYFVKQMTPTWPCYHIARRRSSMATRWRNCLCAGNLDLLCQSPRRLCSLRFWRRPSCNSYIRRTKTVSCYITISDTELRRGKSGWFMTMSGSQTYRYTQ
jgi:hypothetical protein